jgi:hypothetical protein
METNTMLNLTAKQQLFCDEYLIDLNASRAALRAGYSATTALNGALMRLPKIKLYLDARMAEAAQKTTITQDMVLAELYKIAFGNMGNYFDEHGGIKPMHLLSEDAKAALWSTSVSDAGSGGTAAAVTKFRLYNKLTALDKIAKHLGFYKPEVKKPEVKYVYLDRDSLTADDRFEDKSIKKPRKEVAVVGENQESRIKSQESRIKNQDKGSDSGVIADDSQVIESGNFDLVDGAGIPYGKPRVPNPDNFIDLNETPEQLLERIGLKPKTVQPPTVTFSSLLSGRYLSPEVRKERKMQARNWRSY